MSPRFPVATGKDVARIAQKVGFVFDRQKGSHAIYYRKKDGARIVVPMHAHKTIKRRTLSGIIDDMGLTIDEFRQLM
ncbi:MAG: type II toxin-antitoxin system HicA family toxin [Candidatus Coatesbacteria bacterium]|nr:type II toxin-antitoxin system HicA family toxin [Candidatus Coatesbacteria bacterium]